MGYYSGDEVAMWRSQYRSNLQDLGYNDDELMEWRTPFDELSKGGDEIDFATFERFLAYKFRFVGQRDTVKSRIKDMWEQFDEDRSGFIDFGEFVRAGLAFNVLWTKEVMQSKGTESVFQHYAPDGYMGEAHFFDIMCDYRFFVITATDMRNLTK